MLDNGFAIAAVPVALVLRIQQETGECQWVADDDGNQYDDQGHAEFNAVPFADVLAGEARILKPEEMSTLLILPDQ